MKKNGGSKKDLRWRALRISKIVRRQAQEAVLVDYSAKGFSVSEQEQQLKAFYGKFLGLEKKYDAPKDKEKLNRLAYALFKKFKKVLVFPPDWTEDQKDLLIDWLYTKFDKEFGYQP